MKTIEDRVKRAISYQLDIPDDDIKPESRLVEDLGADSLDTVEIVMELESEFDLDITDEDFEPVKTVQQAIDYITKQVVK